MTSPPAPTSVQPQADWLSAAPAPLLQLQPDHRIGWANAAARALLGPLAVPGTPWHTLWVRPADASALLGDAAAEARLLPAPEGALQPVLARASPLAEGGWLLHLADDGPLRDLEAEAEGLRERLDLALRFGRLGMWERDPRTGEGYWDRNTRQVFGLQPEDPTPPMLQSLDRIVAEDRERVRQAYQESLHRLGTASTRYRVQRPDGSIAHVHSQWLVLAGAEGRAERVVGILTDDTEAFELARRAAEAQSSLSLAMELGRIGTWRRDLATDLTELSTQGFRTLGMQPTDEPIAVGRLIERMHPDDREAARRANEQALRQPEPVDLETRYRAEDGGWRVVHTRRVAVRDESGAPIAIFGLGLDITDARAQQLRAAEMARRLELATQTGGIGYWIMEPDQERAFWSPEQRRIFGLRDDEPVPTTQDWLQRHVHAADREAVRRAFADWIGGGQGSAEATFRIVRSDGQVRRVRTHSRIERSDERATLFGVLVDLGERDDAEAARQGAEQRIALAARGAGLASWELDLDTGEAVWDEQMWRLRGLRPRARPLDRDERLACVHPDDRERMRTLIEPAIESHEPYATEFRVVWPDGQVRWLASRSIEIGDQAVGRRTRIGVNWDITDQRNAEALRLERERARHESEAKSRFLARMSHELRTPLNAVLGFTQLLMADDGPGDTASRAKRLEHIRSAGQHLLRLINDVLELAGLEGGEMRLAIEPQPLAPLVEQALTLVAPAAQARRISLHSDGYDVQVLADETRLRQVLLNLLSNAVKYNRDDGRVDVSLRTVPGRALLRVTDTGRGMTPEQMSHLFEPFNRLGAETLEGVEGTGIGLSIARALVERMGGRIGVQSRLGVGSSFEIELPLAAVDPLQAAPAPRSRGLAVNRSAAEVQGGGKGPAMAAAAAPATGAESRTRISVLYIEDNPVNAMIIRELLGRRGDIDLEVAPDGASGVAKAQALRPALVLLDMQLPDLDGLEVLQRLRALPATANIPVVALSANAMPADVKRALDAGVLEYWTKPLDFKAFLASVDQLLGPPG